MLQKVLLSVPELDLQTVFTAIQFWPTELSNLPFALYILYTEVPISSLMRERKVIHMVIDPVTLQNEKIILLLEMESNIYITERR